MKGKGNIYPNGPLTEFVLRGKALSAPEKYYVGVSRPKFSIAIVMKQLPDKVRGYEPSKIDVGDIKISALRYISLQ